MKAYRFPYTGAGGPGDGWAGLVKVELTDKQAKRLDLSIASKKYDDFDDDDSLDDIRQIVWHAIINDTVNNYQIADPDYLREYGKKNDSLEKCAENLLDCNRTTIHYPGTNWW